MRFDNPDLLEFRLNIDPSFFDQASSFLLQLFKIPVKKNSVEASQHKGRLSHHTNDASIFTDKVDWVFNLRLSLVDIKMPVKCSDAKYYPDHEHLLHWKLTEAVFDRTHVQRNFSLSNQSQVDYFFRSSVGEANMLFKGPKQYTKINLLEFSDLVYEHKSSSKPELSVSKFDWAYEGYSIFVEKYNRDQSEKLLYQLQVLNLAEISLAILPSTNLLMKNLMLKFRPKFPT